jgi:opacity protein-like surface antigen
MNRCFIGTAALVLLALSAPASAQSAPSSAPAWEMSGMAGQTQAAGIDKRAPEVTGLDVRGGFTFGIQFARFFTPNWGVEGLWTEQSSALRLETGDGSADLFSMAVRQLHGNAVYQLGAADSRLRPFVFAGLGATFLTGDELQSETKMSFGLGGGVKYFPWQTIGIRGHVRYKPTLLNDEEAGRFCDPFGFCQGTLQQFEFAVGAVIRF